MTDTTYETRSTIIRSHIVTIFLPSSPKMFARRPIRGCIARMQFACGQRVHLDGDVAVSVPIRPAKICQRFVFYGCRCSISATKAGATRPWSNLIQLNLASPRGSQICVRGARSVPADPSKAAMLDSIPEADEHMSSRPALASPLSVL